MSSNVRERINDVGLTEVYCPTDPLVDVVLVHGLNGHPYNTWATHKPEVFWPLDLLPRVVEEQRCRILTYGYNANVTAFTDGASRDHIHNHAEHLAARLVANRSVKARERPIIFVAHSLGGLIVKRLLIYCESINNPKLERLRSIYVSTFGILFLGTPHNGSDLAKMGSALQSICAAVMPKKFLDSSPQLVNALKSNNETLQNINRLFIEIIDPFRIYFFHEQKPMDLKGTRQFIVEEDSAAPIMQGVERMGIEKDHSTMCKFEDANAPGFDVVADAIASYAEEAPIKIKDRWGREKRVREYYRQSMASELLGASLFDPGYQQMQPRDTTTDLDPRSSTGSIRSRKQIENTSPSASYMIEEAGSSSESVRLLTTTSSQTLQKQPRVAPVLFRPNSIFVGFEIELEQLKHKLGSEKTSKIGTCSVLICGPPGSGKSHLARQYVWTQQADYPAGIFWVDCKTKQNTDRYFWDIGQALGCLERDHTSATQSDRSFVNEVRKCLETLQGWLVVFDGIFFDSDDALTDFVQYLPDNSGNSIIYTSVDPTLKNRHRLLNPSWIRMRPLTPRAARDLLFQSLGIREPNAIQVRKAQELVRYYKCLPLGIHAAAHMLVAQGRALEKFSPATTDKRLANPFLEIVRALERRGYDEAICLLVMLSFLGLKVPVVLLQFGSSSLVEFGMSIESTDRAGPISRTLDNTISVLLRYGLVERELQTYSVSRPDANQASPLISRSNTGASMGQLSKTETASVETPPASQVRTDAEGHESNGSIDSIAITIDTLKTHTVTQAVVRDEVQARGLRNIPYEQWLVITCKFLCASYRMAATKLRSLPGQGSVADYREYKSQVTSLWKLVQRQHRDSPVPIEKARTELKGIYREIQSEIQNRSPSHSQSSQGDHLKYIGSVFETSASSSDEGPFTPTDNLTRESTWASESTELQHESPTEYHPRRPAYPEEAVSDFEDDDGYATELEDLTSTTESSQQLNQAFRSTSIPSQAGEGNSRRALLQTILHGHSTSGHNKDLGEFKRVPIVGQVSSPDIEPIRPRSSSSTSSNLPWPFRRSRTGSSAEAALNAIQAKTVGGSGQAGQDRQDSFGSQNKDRVAVELARHPLADKPVNTSMATLTVDEPQSAHDPVSKAHEQGPSYSRRISTSPRLVNTVLARQAAIAWDDLPIEENITITRRFPAPRNAIPPLDQAISYNSYDAKPTGYTSVPMSRDVSRESDQSLLSAPTEAMHIPRSVSSRYLDSYNYQTQALPSVDFPASRSLDLDQQGAWTQSSSFGPGDDLREMEMRRPAAETSSSSIPASPNPLTRSFEDSEEIRNVPSTPQRASQE